MLDKNVKFEIVWCITTFLIVIQLCGCQSKDEGSKTVVETPKNAGPSVGETKIRGVDGQLESRSEKVEDIESKDDRKQYTIQDIQTKIDHAEKMAAQAERNAEDTEDPGMKSYWIGTKGGWELKAMKLGWILDEMQKGRKVYKDEDLYKID